MVLAPVVASAAASQIGEDGLVDKLFKIGIVIGLLVLAVISVLILSLVIDIAGIFVETGSAIQTALGNISQAFSYTLYVFTFGASAFGFGGRN